MAKGGGGLPYLMSRGAVGPVGGPCSVRSNASWVMVTGYPLCEQTDT